MTHGLYLCRVRGLEFCDYAILKHDGDGWWRYFQDYVHNLEGWVGNNLEILEIIQMIEETKE